MPKSHPKMNAKSRRRCPQRCNAGIYHFGAFVLFIGILVAIAGMGTSRLFQIYLYDHRKPAEFLHVDIPVGLFSLVGQVTRLSLDQEWLSHGLQLSDTRWMWAKATCVLGLLVACVALLQHLIMACARNQQSWVKVGFELLGIFSAVCLILVGLSLAECEIEYIHDDGDPDLSRFLSNNGLLRGGGDGSVRKTGLYSSPSQASGQNVSESLERGDLALFVTPPQTSFHLLVAADFLLLLAFIAVLIRFVRLCEKSIKTRRQMHHGSLINKT